ncbi:HET-domain-containing protein [Rhizodiscina lignyota]|uniref:HET-domain-containing protein n=1 Tax=Rhizodiscina lignyota TaxID=1504668 RepID=A0A9P4MC43_9PEZI|nr:HET-domain-containing protein [Rhizodiscina lignyota]
MDDTQEPTLPKRVIKISPLEEPLRLRLMISHGKTGRYATLSHCWGPPEMSPLTTTSHNFEAHLKAIDWAKLPKTFQDTVHVTRQLGLTYLWIDSICIIQDDTEDWLTESAKMGTVYERSEVTIAASHSVHSWQGLFLNRSSQSPPIPLPNFDPRSKDLCIYAEAFLKDYAAIQPESGPLAKRAWATQEWLLARRMIFYCRDRILWSCQTITQEETGEKRYNTARNPKWKIITEHYSERQLTKATDRLVALNGLVSELSKRLNDSYILGLWKNALPDQLLWQVSQQVKEPSNPLQLPSWTWASVPVGIRYMIIKNAKNHCRQIDTSVSGSITITARLKRIYDLRDGGDHRLNGLYPGICGAVGGDVYASNAKNTPRMFSYVVDRDNAECGWAVLDHSISSDASLPPLYALALMGSLTRKASEQDYTVPSGAQSSSKIQEYWILLLEAQDLATHTFTRVGVGKVYGQEYWKDSAVQRVTLV